VKIPSRVGLPLLVALLLAACSTQAAPTAARDSAKPSPAPLTLAHAIARATSLGPADSTTEVVLNFTLKTRSAGALAALLASGRTVAPAEYAARFGPDPALVAKALARLHVAGLQATWASGSTLIHAEGAAPAVGALLHVGIFNYRLGTAPFYASLDTPTLEPVLAAVAMGVSGLDSYRQMRGSAVKPGGLAPVDVMKFYNLRPLRDKGLDGTGETILLPEIEALPANNIADLNRFASEFRLPSFDSVLQVKHDPSWGAPEAPQGEAVMDLEIVHSIAPNAKLIVYAAGPQFVYINRAFDQLVTDNLGSIISESLGTCEDDTSKSLRDAYANIEDRAVAQGMTHFAATGDNGAYSCGEDQPPAVFFPATMPNLTAVGGTTVFESVDGGYFKETVWGSPIDETGTGGGPSHYFAIPAWQKNVEDAAGHGFRQTPDVAGAADPVTGFHIVLFGRDTMAGGTSASTPLWAATVALINQDLTAKGLRRAGFANPALYWMGQNASKFSSAPYHDVTVGNNLAYNAAPGWDFTTGWGSMDGAALDRAWVTYIKSGGA
jgi:kumamolisin